MEFLTSMKSIQKGFLLVVVLCHNHGLGQTQMRILQAARKSVASRRSPQQCSTSHDLPYAYNPGSIFVPSTWGKLSRCCGGDWQSPVNIDSKQLKCNQPHRIRYSTTPGDRIPGKLYNSGMTIKMSFKGPVPALRGVPYWESMDFVLGDIHFHVPSEHTVDGRTFDAELHIVHYKRKYGSVSEAVKWPDGLAVVGIFLQTCSTAENEEVTRIIHESLRTREEEYRTLSVDVRRLFPWSKDFYVYHGSLTTPPCSEAVRWVLMREPIYISRLSLEILRKTRLKDGSLLEHHGNRRPVAPLTGRKIESNFPCNLKTSYSCSV